jgi:hypothetical protein
MATFADHEERRIKELHDRRRNTNIRKRVKEYYEKLEKRK